MTLGVLQLLCAGLACVAAFWALPWRHAQSGVAVTTLLALMLLYPGTAVYLVGTILTVHGVMVWGDRSGGRATIALAASLLLGALFLALRDPPEKFIDPLPLVGAAYFTLRHIHVLAEWAWGRLTAPSLPDMLRYHLLMPVMMSGPIHRFDHFTRACQRRRWSAAEFFTGAERVLVGVALVMIVGDLILGRRLEALFIGPDATRFTHVWLASAVEWARLYFYFSGYTEIALGLCMMMGLELEENFNKPWRAKSLIDFWSRWHMTLSRWCRDYIYVPVSATTRSPLLGVSIALLVLGIWHQTSLYYIVWAAWQAAGIVLTHAYGRIGDPLRLRHWPPAIMAVIAPVAILAWLSGARPVIAFAFGGLAP